MKIKLIFPAFAAHGGTRVAIEIANRLFLLGHSVSFHSLAGNKGQEYWNIDKRVKITDGDLTGIDCLILMSPHSSHFLDRNDLPKKVFLHCQMAEHIFNRDKDWQNKCKRFYTAPYPMFSISEWNIKMFKEQFGRLAPTHYIGNGVNFDDFPLESPEKDGKTVLVEGWEGYNPAKDVNKIAPIIAGKLKREGYKIVSYGQMPLKTLAHIPDEYHLQPSLEKINQLYSEATILLKASRFDARSCSPVEAGTKRTVTARAIIEGDDDLIDGYNCLKVKYNQNELYRAAKKLLTDQELRNKLADNMTTHLKENSWDKWMKEINQIITND